MCAKKKGTNSLSNIKIEIGFAYAQPRKGYELPSEEYAIEPPEFSVFGTEVWIRSEYDIAYKTDALEELTTYEIVGMEVIAPRRQGRLIEHPYWVYQIQPLQGGEKREIEESEIVIPHSMTAANYF